MHIERLLLTNFKNYSDLEVSFSHNVNCLVGNNGVGKTNLLDAIYYLSFCKSYFNPSDNQNIKFGADFFAINGLYHFDTAQNDISESHPLDETPVLCTFRRGLGKKMKFNKKTYTSFSEHIGKIPLVIVTPGDQSLIMGGSEERRKFIDGIISQVNHTYLQNLIHYQKAVDQRNKLLKQFFENRFFEDDAIALWDEQLVRFGEPIITERLLFLQDFMPLFEQYYSLIHSSSTDNEHPSLKYALSSSDTSLQQSLLLNHARDAHLQYTSVGPHKDDLELLINDVPVKKFGSQGQQKTFLLALKLAQFEYIKSHRNINPILLLDDVFDKLDIQRVSQLVALVGSDRFGQVFITDTQPGRVESIFNHTPLVSHKIFHVQNSLLTEI